MWLILIAILIVLAYKYLTRNYDYFKERGIPFAKPWPIFGSETMTLLRLRTPTAQIQMHYNAYPNSKYIGTYFMETPSLMVKDPEMLKQICVKEFDHFVDHSPIFVRGDLDSLFAKNLFSLRGKKWKEMRATLSPAFTSSKMKMMFDLVSDTSRQVVEHINIKLAATTEDESAERGDVYETEMKDLFTRFTNDVIATCAFGVKVDSLKNPDNDFYIAGKDLTEFSPIRLILINFVPSLMKLFGQGLIRNHPQNFLRKLIDETLKMREEKGIVRPDMIHLLMEARKGNLKHEDSSEKANEVGFAAFQESQIDLEQKGKQDLTNEDITAQALIFFIAGFDTASTLLCFLAHELALNNDIQKKLQKEIDETLTKNNGKVTYDAIFKMEYLDMVVSEALRKWSPAVNTDRYCIKECTITSDGDELLIEKNTAIQIPVCAIHYDPKYYPNPQKFDPERFNKENKGKIDPYTYLPFGIGPRGCIGSRFALMEIKVIMFHFLTNFSIVVTERTDVKTKLLRHPFRLAARNGFWLGFKQRE